MEHEIIGIIAHADVDCDLLLSIVGRLEREGVKLCFDQVAAGKTNRQPTPLQEMDVSLAVILGGDGTLLWSAKHLSSKTPLLGINTGRVGYLTAADASRASEAIEKVLTGEYVIEERARLRINRTHDILNEIVILPQKPAQLVDFLVNFESEQIEFRADGLLISTQTGSTGHALSVGGPVIHPKARVYLIAPMIPYRREQPPIIVPETAKTTVEIIGKMEDIQIVFDGKIIETHKRSEKITIEKSPLNTSFIRFEPPLKKK